MLKEVRSSLYESNGSSKLNIFLNALIILIIFMLAFEIFFTSNFSGVYVVHSSMSPTLIGADSKDSPGGDYIYIDRHAQPDYGDIVVVYDGQGEFLIKRAIAFGGDSVKLVKGKLYIRYKGTAEFVLVEEKYLSESLKYNDPSVGRNTFADDEQGYLVREGHFFLLGDNRNASNDSRMFGSFPIENLDGVVTLWSLRHKSFFTAFHNYFKYQLPSYFGINRDKPSESQ